MSDWISDKGAADQMMVDKYADDIARGLDPRSGNNSKLYAELLFSQLEKSGLCQHGTKTS